MNKRVLPRKTPSRDEFYLALAWFAAAKSKDPRTQCGAFVVSRENEPLGWGYNGPPASYDDNKLNWDRPYKYDYIIHAEENAMDRSKGSLRGATLYVTDKPCARCMLRIANKGIARVVYFPTKRDQNSMLSDADMGKTDEIAKKGSVRLEVFNGNLNWMRDRIVWMEAVGIFDGNY